MKIFYILFTTYLYLKIYYYSDYEIKEKNNKSNGITLKVISTIGFIISLFILLFFY